MTALRDRVRDTVKQLGYQYRDEPFRLSSGEMSHDFVDAKRALAGGDDLRVACEALTELVGAAGIDFDAVGGLTMGADQFAHGVAVVTGKQWFVVRKEPKGRGTNKLVEGADLHEGVRALLVEDVVTTGGSIVKALHAVRDTGASVVAAVTLVDRGDAAATLLASEGVEYLPLLTYRDLGIDPVGVGIDPVAGGPVI